jgi:lipopolysaccharide/colanic/teichoic acid biosynthesis glycosyltransferase
MLHNIVGVQGGREIAAENRHIHSVKSQRISVVANRSREHRSGLKYWIGYVLAEYVWAHVILMCVVAGNFASRGIGAVSLKHQAGNILKRSIDVLGSVVGLILTSPFFIILPIIIKLDSPGPVFYRQSRIGHNRRRGERRQAHGSALGRVARDRRRQDLKGRPFNVIKFRTMIADAEKKCGPVWATKNDPRITRLGRFLRKSRLDEIPQFVNVFLGQMSLVGPRPERPVFVEELSSQVEDY